MLNLNFKRPSSLQDEVAVLLETNILSGEWVKGEKIPTEHRLCESLSVSRTIVREAIATLKSKGLLESRQGSGVFVLRNTPLQTLNLESYGLDEIETLRELMELRFCLEINNAQMAATRANAAQIQALSDAHQSLVDAVRSNQLGIEEDMHFHMAIADAANNQYISKILNFLQNQIAETVKAARSRSILVSGRPDQVLAEHQELLQAITARNPEAARIAAWVHQINAAKRIGIRGLLAWESLRMSNLSRPRQLPASSPVKPVISAEFKLPDNTCDSNIALFGDPALYPVSANRSYTPGHIADLAVYEEFSQAMGIARGVFLQPSIYGTDNSLLLHSLAQAPANKFRGVAHIDVDVSDEDLVEMHKLGVRGARVNTLFRTASNHCELVALSERISSLGWHIDLQADVSEYQDFYGLISSLSVPVVVDHMGHIPSDIGVKSRGFQDTLRLLKEGRIWVRLSGFCRITTHETLPFSDVQPYVDALVQTRSDRLLWGADWARPGVDFTPPNPADLFMQLRDWVGDQKRLQLICSTNPDTLYWSDSSQR